MITYTFFLLPPGEEIECKASWRDGAFHYLVAKINHVHALTDEEKFRCYVYDYQVNNNKSAAATSGGGKRNNNIIIEKLNLAQSADATCNGLFSPTDSSKTLTLKRGT